MLEGESSVKDKNQTMISSSTTFYHYAHLVHLATSTGIELFQDGLNREASYHYNLALQNILKMVQAKRNKQNDHQQVVENGDFRERMAQSRHICLERLGEPVILLPLSKVSASGARDSNFCQESWIQCSSMVILHNSALVHFKTKHYTSARALLCFALQLLASEVYEKPSMTAFFFEDPQKAALAMSLHFLMANVLLKEGQCSPDHDLISNDNIVEAVVLECSLAIKLAEKYLQVDARNGLLVAQVLSLLGYCMLLMFDDSQDIQDALEFYQTATTLYNGYRGEADMARTPLAEMDKTKNSFRRQADITTGEVTACAA
jgi:hypothetical protein